MGAFTSLTNCQFSINVTGNAQITPAGQNPVLGTIGPITAGGFLRLGTGAGNVNEAVSYVITPELAANGTTTLTLSNGLRDVCNQVNVPLVRVCAMLIQLLSTAQDSTYGTTCTSISIGGAPVNPWTGILNAAGIYTINNGGFWGHGDFSATGLLIAAGSSDQLKIVNNDPSTAAGIQITFFGS